MIRPSILRESDEQSLGAPEKREKNPEIERLAKEYARQAELPPIRKTQPVSWDADRCRTIAKEFDRLPFLDDSPLVREAYDALADEIRVQYEFLARHIEIEPYGDEDPVPYQDSREMMADVLNNRHLWVYSGGEDHALLSREDNFKFRAVHDLFGHAARGFGFGPRGEENAWIEHSKLLSPLARAALTTETRGQNSFVNCMPAHADLPPQERPYAEQKAALLDEKFWTHPILEEAYKDYPDFI